MVLMTSTSTLKKTQTYQVSDMLWEISQLNLIDNFQLDYLSAQKHTFDY